MSTNLNNAWTPSKLTVARPDIWVRGLELASSVTGMTYLDKLPLYDGTIYACGGSEGGYYNPRSEKEPPRDIEEDIVKVDKDIRRKTRRLSTIEIYNGNPNMTSTSNNLERQ